MTYETSISDSALPLSECTRHLHRHFFVGILGHVRGTALTGSAAFLPHQNGRHLHTNLAEFFCFFQKNDYYIINIYTCQLKMSKTPQVVSLFSGETIFE